MIKCRFENKDEANLRHVTVNTILTKGNQVLLEKRGTYNGKKILESGKWSLIGGFLDRDETTEEGARREIREETGWSVKNLKLFKINDSPNRPKEDRQNVDVIFIAEVDKQDKTEDEEVTETRWFDLTELPPKEEIAFDHSDSLDLYKRYLTEKLELPLLW